MSCLCQFRGQSWGWRNVWGTPNTDEDGNEDGTYTRKFWVGLADDQGTSQHCFDPYSLDHFTSAVFQYIVIPPGGPGQYCISQSINFGNSDGTTFPWQWFLINSCLHFLWEIGENLPCCIYYFRASGVDPVYYGDSVVNSITDQMLNATGYILTWSLV